MKPSLDPIKIKFVTRVKSLKSTIKVPEGEIHIFEIIDAQTNTYSFCGIEHSQIREETIETDKRPENLSVCKACEDSWKTDNRSPWKAWSRAVIQKEEECQK